VVGSIGILGSDLGKTNEVGGELNAGVDRVEPR
jgi:hypothetical protein